MTRTLLRSSSWSAAHGGLRGSTSLGGGALLLALGALLNVGGRLAGGPAAGHGHPHVVMAGWLAWIMGLAVAGWGLAWVGAGPVLSKLAWAPAVAFLADAVCLVVLLFVPDVAAPPHWPLAAARLLLLALVAWREAAWLGRGTAILLGATTLAAAAKILLRELGLLPQPGLPVGPFLDALPNLAVAVALFQTALRVRAAEDRWAAAALAAPTAGFEQFDNPDHMDLAGR